MTLINRPAGETTSSEAQSVSAGQRKAWWQRRGFRGVVGTILVLYGALLAGDGGYAIWVGSRIAIEERGWKFDAHGVREGCEARTIGAGSTAVLLVHGFNDSPRIWDRMADDLAVRGMTCRAMRLPGFAERHREYARHDLEDWLQAIRAELTLLRADHERVILVGHSLGGALSLRLAWDAPELMDGVVLVAPAIDVSDVRSPMFSVRTWHRIAQSVLIFVPATASPFGVDARDPEGVKYEYRTAYTPRKVIDSTLQLIDSNLRTGELGTELQVPVLLAVSPDDRVVSSEAAVEWFDKLVAPRKERFEASRSGHAIPLDFDELDLCGAIDRFQRGIEE